MQHTITLEPLTAELRRVACLPDETGQWAVVERIDGHLVKFCTAVADREAGQPIAVSYARTYGATFDDREAAPAVRPSLLARLAGFIGRGREAAPVNDREAVRTYERAGFGFFL